MDTKQIDEGVFCQLKTGRWDANIRMPNKHFGENIPKEIVRARQDIIKDRTLLKDLGTIRRTAKGLLQRNSLPFPVDGVFWVPKNKIVGLDKEFTKFQAEYTKRIGNLCNNIKQMEEEFKKQYPNYYDGKNYPTIPAIRKKFYFYWSFFHFAVPSKKTKVLSASIYEKEQKKFSKMMSEMEEMTINIIGNMLFRRIDKLANQCSTGKINGGTVKSVDRLLKRWDTLWKDHVDEKKLSNIMTSLRREMKRTSIERLKGNNDFRNKIGNRLTNIIGKIQTIPDLTLKRKLDI